MIHPNDNLDKVENEKNKEGLIELLLSGEAVLFVGAGSSRRLDFPDWKGLIDSLIDFAQKRCNSNFTIRMDDNSEKFLEQVDKIKNCIVSNTSIQQYYKYIQSLFSEKKHDKFHERLTTLPVKFILTTNYDGVLESALGDLYPKSKPQPVTLLENVRLPLNNFILDFNKEGGTKKYIMHLHGFYELPESMILGASDYQRFYDPVNFENKLNMTKISFWKRFIRFLINIVKKIIVLNRKKPRSCAKNLKKDANTDGLYIQKIHSKLLWSFFATRRVVFVGCSIDDPYLKHILEIACSDLWNWNDCFHYAIIGVPSDDKVKAKKLIDNGNMLKRKYGIGVFFYEFSGDDHKGLERLILEVKAKKEEKKIKIEEQNGENKLDLKKYISNSEKGKEFWEWEEKINKRMQDPRIADEN